MLYQNTKNKETNSSLNLPLTYQTHMDLNDLLIDVLVYYSLPSYLICVLCSGLKPGRETEELEFKRFFVCVFGSERSTYLMLRALIVFSYSVARKTEVNNNNSQPFLFSGSLGIRRE